MSINKAAVPGSGQVPQETMGHINFITGMGLLGPGSCMEQESCPSEPVEGGNGRRNQCGLNQEQL